MAELRTLISEVAANAIGAGLIGIIVSDKDGVPVLKVGGDANSSMMEGCFRQNLHWKLGQQTPFFGSLLAYLETTS